MENTELAAKLAETFAALSKTTDIGFQINVIRQVDTNVSYLTTSITINHTDANASKYMDMIHSSHDGLQTIGYTDLTLISGMYSATVQGFMHFASF